MKRPFQIDDLFVFTHEVSGKHYVFAAPAAPSLLLRKKLVASYSGFRKHDTSI